MGRLRSVSSLVAAPFPVVVAGPSGAGKTTVCRGLLAVRADLSFSVSLTTRTARPEETPDRDYRFVDREMFERLRSEGQLLEWAEVHGELYGTPLSNLVEASREGKHLLLDIDVQGARSVRAARSDAVLVFLIPPSGERIVARLRKRGSEEEKAVRRRLTRAREELQALEEFDYLVVNDDLEHAVAILGAILDGESHRVLRLAGRGQRRALELADEIEGALT